MNRIRWVALPLLVCAFFMGHPTSLAAPPDEVYWLLPDANVLATQKGDVLVAPEHVDALLPLYADADGQGLREWASGARCLGYAVRFAGSSAVYAWLTPDGHCLTAYDYQLLFVYDHKVWGLNQQNNLVQLYQQSAAIHAQPVFSLAQQLPEDYPISYQAAFTSLPGNLGLLEVLPTHIDETLYQAPFCLLFDPEARVLATTQGAIGELTEDLLFITSTNSSGPSVRILNTQGQPVGDPQGYLSVNGTDPQKLVAKKPTGSIVLLNGVTGLEQLLIHPPDAEIGDVYPDMLILTGENPENPWNQAYTWTGTPLIDNGFQSIQCSSDSLLLCTAEEKAEIYTRTGQRLQALPCPGDVYGDYIMCINNSICYYWDAAGHEHQLPEGVQLHSKMPPTASDFLPVASLEENALGLLDDTGRLLIPAIYEEILPISSGPLAGNFLCTQYDDANEKRMCILGPEAEVIVPAFYSSLELYDEHILFRQNTALGMMDFSGKEIWRVDALRFILWE